MLDMCIRGILIDLVKNGGIKSGLMKNGDSPLWMPGLGQARIGDEKHAGAAQLTGEVAEPTQGAAPVDDSAERQKVKRRQRLGGRAATLAAGRGG